MVARYYSSSLARFMAVDPGDDTDLENPQSWNKYAYVRNNPIKNTDPTGEFIETAFDVAMAVVSVTQAVQNPTGGNILGAALDVAAVIVPGMPAVGGRLVDAAQGINKIDNALDAGKVAEGAGGAASAASKSVGEMADDLSGQLGKNSVSFETPTTSGHIDLKGKPHFDKATGQEIPTPHVQTQTKHVGPNGEVNLSGDVQTRPATKQDVRNARKLEEKRQQSQK
jgi:hypothetical protein